MMMMMRRRRRRSGREEIHVEVNVALIMREGGGGLNPPGL